MGIAVKVTARLDKNTLSGNFASNVQYYVKNIWLTNCKRHVVKDQLMISCLAVKKLSLLKCVSLFL